MFSPKFTGLYSCLGSCGFFHSPDFPDFTDIVCQLVRQSLSLSFSLTVCFLLDIKSQSVQSMPPSLIWRIRSETEIWLVRKERDTFSQATPHKTHCVKQGQCSCFIAVNCEVLSVGAHWHHLENSYRIISPKCCHLKVVFLLSGKLSQGSRALSLVPVPLLWLIYFLPFI